MEGCQIPFRSRKGVPQGSCLSPLLFTVYASKLFDIVGRHLPSVHSYADDTQLYLAFSSNVQGDDASAVKAICDCIMDLRKWMIRDRLMLNDDKTEFLLLGTKQQLAKVDINSITVGGSVVNTKPVVRNLGSWFDSQLSLCTHISKLCSSTFFHLHNISRIRKFLSPVETNSLVNAFITSRVDYCNSLLYGLPASQQLAKFDINSITVSESVVNTEPVVRNLGSWFDSQLSMSTHISKLCSSTFFHLHNISRIRKFLGRVETKSFVHALVTSRVDYCNSLSCGLPASQLSKVQRVLNTAARFVCCAPRFSHITPLMYELHWLPLKQRIHFKILLFAFKAIHGIAPTYIQHLVSLKSQGA